MITYNPKSDSQKLEPHIRHDAFPDPEEPTGRPASPIVAHGYESGLLVPAVGPEYPADEAPDVRALAVRGASEAVRRLLMQLTDGATAGQVGQRTILLALRWGCIPDVRTQRQLATRLGVSLGTANKIFHELKPVTEAAYGEVHFDNHANN